MDAEGHDAAALHGGARALLHGSLPLLFIEYEPRDVLAVSGCDPRRLMRALWGEVATPEAARLEVLAYRDSVPRAGFAGLSVNAVDAADGRRTLLTRELSVAPLGEVDPVGGTVVPAWSDVVGPGFHVALEAGDARLLVWA